jgi:cytoskeletal protein CcmA (bactofilin family)
LAIFGDKDEKLKINKLSKENSELKEQIAEYEKVFGNFEDMKKVTDRVREENKRLLQKLEDNIEVKGKLEKRVEELNEAVNAKKENFLSKIFAMESKDDEIVVGNNVEFSGGIKSPKNIKVGDNVVINGIVNSNETISFGNDDRVVGNVLAVKGVKTGNKCVFTGDIKAKGRVEIGDKCVLKNVISDSDIVVGNGTKIEKISSKGNVFLKDGVSVEKGIEYKDAINIGQNVSIAGEIKTLKDE